VTSAKINQDLQQRLYCNNKRKMVTAFKKSMKLTLPTIHTLHSFPFVVIVLIKGWHIRDLFRQIMLACTSSIFFASFMLCPVIFIAEMITLLYQLLQPSTISSVIAQRAFSYFLSTHPKL